MTSPPSTPAGRAAALALLLAVTPLACASPTLRVDSGTPLTEALRDPSLVRTPSRTARFELRAPAALDPEPFELAFDAVESHFGPFETPVTIFVFGRLYESAGRAPAGTDRGGMALRIDGAPAIAVAPPDVLAVCRHELTHLRVRELGHELPFWLDEGLAELLEGTDPAAAPEDLLDALPTSPRATDLPATRPRSVEAERRARAVGWAIVRALHLRDGVPLAAIAAGGAPAAVAALPPAEALEWTRRTRPRNRAFSPAPPRAPR